MGRLRFVQGTSQPAPQWCSSVDRAFRKRAQMLTIRSRNAEHLWKTTSHKAASITERKLPPFRGGACALFACERLQLRSPAVARRLTCSIQMRVARGSTDSGHGVLKDQHESCSFIFSLNSNPATFLLCQTACRHYLLPKDPCLFAAPCPCRFRPLSPPLAIYEHVA